MSEVLQLRPQEAAFYQSEGALALQAAQEAHPPLRVISSEPARNLIDFASHKKRKQETVLFEETSVIADSLKAIQKDWIQEEVHEDEMYLLPGTGFDVKGEVDRFSKNVLRLAQEGSAVDDVLGTAFLELGGNIYGYSLEYLRSKAMLPFKHEIITDADGKLRLKPFGYDGFLRDAISPQERYGAVVQSVDVLEEKLPEAVVGDIFVMTSPPGWTGFVGKRYVETQTKLQQVVEENGEKIIRGYTIRSMMNVTQNITFMEKVGADTSSFFDPDDRRQLASISAAVKHLSGNHGETIASLTKTIQEIVGSEIAFEGYTFEEVYKDIPKFNEHLVADQLTMQLVEQLKTYGKELLTPYWKTIAQTGEIPEEVIKKFRKATGMTVLRLSDAITRELKGGNVDFGKAGNLGELMRGEKQLDFDPRQQLHEDQQKPGCNGGGKKEGSSNGKQYMIVMTASGARLIEFDGESYDYTHEGPCRACGKDVLCGPCKVCLDCDIKKREESEAAEAA